MIKIGDKVKFLNDVGGGVVTGFINKNTVNVENEDGFEIPYPISQLVNVSAPEINQASTPEPKSFSEEQDIKNETPEFLPPKGEQINGKNSPDFYFCFIPRNENNILADEIELYLVNDSNYELLYNFSHIALSTVESVKSGAVVANSRVLLESIKQTDLSDLPDFGFQMIYFKPGDEDLNQPFTKVFKVNPVKFYKESSFHSNTFFKNRGIILQISPNILSTEIDKLTQADFKKVLKEKEANPAPVVKIKKSTTDEIIIDLHITELLDSTTGLSNREMLEIQMEKVESEMKLAIQNRVKRIVFIHGVGQGVLKQEVANLLKRRFKKYYFQDASFKEYGYGATMVILRR